MALLRSAAIIGLTNGSHAEWDHDTHAQKYSRNHYNVHEHNALNLLETKTSKQLIVGYYHSFTAMFMGLCKLADFFGVSGYFYVTDTRWDTF